MYSTRTSWGAQLFALDLDKLVAQFDPILEGVEPSERERGHLYGLANVFDLKSADDTSNPAAVWRDLKAVLLRQRPSSTEQFSTAETGVCPGEGKTVLVVEDDPDIAAPLVAGLVDGGHYVIGPATSAEVAMVLADLHAIDVALIDINLTREGEGVDLAQRLRDRFALKVVFLSANVAAIANNAEDCDAFIIKPYRIEDALRVIAEIAGTDGSDTAGPLHA